MIRNRRVESREANALLERGTKSDSDDEEESSTTRSKLNRQKNGQRRHSRRIYESSFSLLNHATQTQALSEETSRRKRSSRKRRMKSRRVEKLYQYEDEPFSRIVLKVGSTLFLFCMMAFIVYQIVSFFGSFSNEMKDSSSLRQPVGTGSGGKLGAMELSDTITTKENILIDDIILEHHEDNSTSLTHIDGDQEVEKYGNSSSDSSQFVQDFEFNLPVNKTIEHHPVYQLLDLYSTSSSFNNKNESQDEMMAETKTKNSKFWELANEYQERFKSVYGGLNASQYLLNEFIDFYSPPSSIITNKTVGKQQQQYQPYLDLINKIYNAKKHKRTFRIAFTGYNAITGRGNAYKKSTSFFLQEKLKPLYDIVSQESIEIVNVAQADISPFPYGWCLKDILSSSSSSSTTTLSTPIWDVIFIDFSRNEPGFEPFLRNVASISYDNKPVIILYDINLTNDDDNDTISGTTSQTKKKKAIIERRELFFKYIKEGIISSSSFLFYSMESSSFVLKPFFKQQNEKELSSVIDSNQIQYNLQIPPEGFQSWDMYDTISAESSSSQHQQLTPKHLKSKYNPTVKEHELMSWILTMHFLTALEYIELNITSSSFWGKGEEHPVNGLPKPFTDLSTKNKDASSIVTFSDDSTVDHANNNNSIVDLYQKKYYPLSYGIPESNTTNTITTSNSWTMRMRKRHCYTSFSPPHNSHSSPNNNNMMLISLIVSESSHQKDLDILLPRGPMFYHKNWVYDMMEIDKQNKRNELTVGKIEKGVTFGFDDDDDKEVVVKQKKHVIEQFEKGGYPDSKTGYFGVKPSGNLDLFLPYFHDSISVLEKKEPQKQPQVGDSAWLFFETLTICGINQSRGMNSCEMKRDLNIRIDGCNVTDVEYVPGEEVRYLGKELCLAVAIPKEASLSLSPYSNQEISDHDANDGVSSLGLDVIIFVANPDITIRTGPCSISHVLWEQRW